ncbi:hypothetical protein [Alkalicoccus luteus]|uniref:Uncharacterized protein n=1 Tax=Alkalicoccus luteus TaxID=1237094 RepID=A0A969PSR9_9BACI|nr:hypothetical protein [Alkalicoccus luteus]NJP37263.1 hypothetical protein [Alkalicoccus luteus]
MSASENMMIYVIPALIICIIALFWTIQVARNPEDEGYENQKKQKLHFGLLIGLYAVGFIPAIAGVVLYFFYW